MRSGVKRREILDLWLDMVQRYVAGNLSFENDRSYAIGDIASLFSSRLNCDYFYGMWTEDAARSLAWSPGGRPPPEAFRRSDVPTWSWMSRCFADGRNSWLAIRYNTSAIDFIADGRFEANFRETHTENINQEVSAGAFNINATCELEVRSAWFQVSVPGNYADMLKKDTMDASSELLPEPYSGLRLALSFRPDWVDSLRGLSSGTGDILKALVLGRSADKASQDHMLDLLIIRKVHDDRGYDMYERVGYAKWDILATEADQAWKFIDRAGIGIHKLR